MYINITAHPKAKRNEVIKLGSNTYKVKVTAPAENNKANLAMIKLLADYFKVKKNQVELVAGKTSKDKIFNIQL